MGWIQNAVTAVTVRALGYENPKLRRLLLDQAGGGGGGNSAAGRHVTVDSAMQIATAWACVRLISQTWGTLPVEVRVWDGKSSNATRDHPLYYLLHEQPNADMTAVEFWSALGVALMTWGNAYAEVFRQGGRVVAIAPLPPRLITPERTQYGSIVYRYDDPSGYREIPEENVLHIKGLTHDGLIGLSPISQACNTLGTAMAAEEASGKLFSNGLRVAGHYTSPTVLSASQRAEAKNMIEGFHSTQMAGRAPLLEGGFKFESATIPPHEAELLANRQFGVEEIARWYGVPGFMIGHTEKSTSWGAGLEQQMLAFHQLTLRPILKNAEQAIRRRLLTPVERGKIDIEFNVEGLLRADSSGRAAFIKTMVEAGIYTRNEGRAREGLPPKDGGDDLTVQSNMMPLTRLGEATSRADLTDRKPLAVEDTQ
jgi:HK97 family phage portal protein